MRKHGFAFHRNGGNHEVWRHTNGYQYVVPYGSKSSDPRAWRNALSNMRRAGVIK